MKHLKPISLNEATQAELDLWSIAKILSREIYEQIKNLDRTAVKNKH
jgi:hypothetical protein